MIRRRSICAALALAVPTETLAGTAHRVGGHDALAFVTSEGTCQAAWGDRACGAVAFHPGIERGSGRPVITGASSTCSGIAQKPWAFSTIFRGADR